MSKQVSACAAVCCAFLVSAPALAHEGDIGLAVIGGRVAVGSVAENSVTFAQWVEPGRRVFGGELDASGFTDEPGLYGSALSEGGALTFPAGGRVGFNILAPLAVWDAGGFQSTTARLRVEFASGAQSVVTPLAGVTPGFTIAAGGEFDEHYDYFLTDASGAGLPAAGVYLLQMEFFGQTAAGGAIGASDPVFVVLNFGLDEEEHDVAIVWAEANLVPAPGAAAVLAVGAFTAARRRRR